MRSKVDLAKHLLSRSSDLLARNVEGLKLDEALYAGNGHRSVLGVLKHIGGWGHVYHSYAFDRSPRHWRGVDWPRGLIDTIDKSQEYLDEVVEWCLRPKDLWLRSLEGVDGKHLDQRRPLHWGESAPLFDIAVLVANHYTYHAGELNMLLSMARGEAWEESEEVEENHIDTSGHRVRPAWRTQGPIYSLRDATQNKSDDEVETWLESQGGVDAVMQQIFDSLQERLNSSWEEDVVLGYELVSAGKTYPYVVSVKSKTVAYEIREPTGARVTTKSSVADYIRLITGQLDPLKAFSAGRLRFDGDVAFAPKIPQIFRY